MTFRASGAPMKVLMPITATALIAAVVVAGCGGGSSNNRNTTSTSQTANPNAKESSPPGDIPDNQAYVAYSPPGGGYSIKVPEGWARTAQGGTVTFTDKLNSVAMESHSAPKAPTVAAAKADPAFPHAQVTVVNRKAGKAVRIVYTQAAAPDPVTGKRAIRTVERYEFFKNGKQVDLALSGAKGADNVDPWKTVTDSLTWTA